MVLNFEAMNKNIFFYKHKNKKQMKKSNILIMWFSLLKFSFAINMVETAIT